MSLDDTNRPNLRAIRAFNKEVQANEERLRSLCRLTQAASLAECYANRRDFAITAKDRGYVRIFDNSFKLNGAQVVADDVAHAEAVNRFSTGRPGEYAAIVAEETGMSYERALVFCNMD